jgi:hypothetical protein
LHRLLDGRGQQPAFHRVSPFAFYLSRLCEEFPGVLPSEMVAEIERLPAGLLEEMLESRHYGRAYALYQQNPRATGGLVDEVKQIEFELAQEEMNG